MKRITYGLILTLIIMLSLTGCYETLYDTTDDQTVAVTTAPIETEPLSDNPLIAAELHRGTVYNGSNTSVIGEYAYINIEKSVLKGITLEQYTEFCETVVDGSGYNWVSIMCDDGTGIQFTGSQSIFASYGIIDQEGIIQEEIGLITKTENGFDYEPTEESATLQMYPMNPDSTYIDIAAELPDHIFNTSGSENGLAGTVYSFTGTVDKYFTTDAGESVVEQIVVDTNGGKVVIANMYKANYNLVLLELGVDVAKAYYPYDVEDYVFPDVGETAEFLVVYWGYSGAMEMPMFVLGANQSIISEIQENMASS